MKCFNCGNETKKILCDKCHDKKILDKIYEEILKKDANNPYIKEYMENLKEGYLRDCIPTLLSNFDEDTTEYHYCHYYYMIRDSKFEEMAGKYVDTHKIEEKKTQRILCDILSFYLREDYFKPKKWCDLVLNTKEDLVVELYSLSAEFYSMIAEYDLSEKMIKRGIEVLNNNPSFVFSNETYMKSSFDKLDRLLIRYREGNPYWPATEERRIQVKKIYEEKGIEIPQKTSDHKSFKFRNRDSRRVKASDFKAENEWYDSIPKDYISFYCLGVYSTKTVITLYEIGAVKVVNGKVIEKFSDIIKPWEASKEKVQAAEKLGISVDELNKADSVEEGMKKFVEFIGDDLIVSTEGLSLQKNILTRAMRYAFYKELKNPIGDILDYAADVSSKFDFENNNRKYLIDYFKIKGKDKTALEKATTNFKIIEKLRDYKD